MAEERAPCTCGWLERMAAEPSSPVTFDEQMNEYHLTDLPGPKGGHSYSMIRCCPWCGGGTPKSKRDTFFAIIPNAEESRLRKAYGDLKMVDEAIARLGPPDHDMPDGFGTMSPATDTEPEKRESFRVLRYSKLSEVAHVSFTVFGPPRGLHFSLEGKYIGPKRETSK